MEVFGVAHVIFLYSINTGESTKSLILLVLWNLHSLRYSQLSQSE
jgi:hypothetical protein